MISFKYTISLADTDAAGVLFFANQFRIIHLAYEELLNMIGFPIKDILAKHKFALPIVQADAEFMRPLRVGDQIEINAMIKSVANSSFSIMYAIRKDDSIYGTAKTIHISINKETGKKTPLDPAFKEKLNSLGK